MTTSRRWSPALLGGIQLTIQVLLAVILFFVLQFIANRHNIRFDLTPAQSFVLSPQARQVAAAFTRPARATAFYGSQDSGPRQEMRDVLEQFEAAAPAFRFRMFDLDRSPGLARKYGVSRYNTGVLEVEGRAVGLARVDEAEITRALIELSREEPRRLCFVTGHGERNPRDRDERSGYSEVAKHLEREHFAIDTLTTLPPGGVPEDCVVLVLAGPSHDLLPGEGEALLRHLRRGGQALLLVDPDAPPSVVEMLADLGVEAGDNLIVDEQNRFIGADSFMPQVVRFRTDLFGDRLESPAVLALARTVRPLPVEEEEPSPETMATSIATTSPDSWAMTGFRVAPDRDVRFRPETDQPGPLSVGVLVTFQPEGDTETEETGEREGRLVVLGDSDFASNFYLNLLGNKDFFMSTIALLAADPELITVRQKGAPRGTMSPISLTAGQARLIFWIAVIVLPGLSLLAGTIVAVARRRQKGGR
jgi:ABC-type uncharacterized transport system involved in gliding motility auxiliary subunit